MKYGSKGISLLECINSSINKWRLRWNVQLIKEDDNLVTFEEKQFNHKPNIDEIKATIYDWMNSNIDNEILTGFIWRDMPVWLSSENQFNYKAAFDLAIQNEGATFPVKFKLSDDNYFTFENIEDLRDLYISAMNYIQTTLNAGWANKDSFDFSPYEEILSNI